MYLFLAVLGLHCCTGFLLLAARGGCLHCRVWALGAQAAVVVARGLSSCGSQTLERRLSSCGAQA